MLAVEPKRLVGKAKPRIAPPVPARSNVAEFRGVASDLGIDPMPWQETAARYLTAEAPDGRHLYREVAVVVARQNGKTELLLPLIVGHLLAGKRVMHTAQNMKLPFEVFTRVADYMSEHHAKLFPLRNGRVTRPRFTNGKEEIKLTNGGIYSIVAATRGGARGPSRDLVIVDEVREFVDYLFIAAAKPTMTASKDPMMLYLSNAGDESSVVLNALRSRAESDPRLAYLEWSASPDRAPDDPVGWAEANPALGHERGEMGSILETLTDDYRTAKLEGTLAIFETEHLCRWVTSMREPLVDVDTWRACEAERLLPFGRTYMGVAMDPAGSRASAALAWQQADGTLALRLLFDVVGSPINVARLGVDMREAAHRHRVRDVGIDPLTDGELAKFFRKTQSIRGDKAASAAGTFVRKVEEGKLRWMDSDAVTEDLMWTARKSNDERGSFQAVRANDDRPVTAALAAIRAVELATGPIPTALKVY